MVTMPPARAAVAMAPTRRTILVRRLNLAILIE